MRNGKKYILAKIAIVSLPFIVIIVAVVVFMINTSQRSVQTGYREVQCDANISAEIYEHKLGLPHIISPTDAGAFFALGYKHAQERLWDMCYERIVATGRMSEFFGAGTREHSYVEADKFMRTLELHRIAKSIYSNTDEATKQILNAYTDGVNKYIDDNEGRYPFNFGYHNIVPEKWHPEDCYTIERYFAFMHNNNFLTDVVYTEVANKLGEQKTKDLYRLDAADTAHYLPKDKVFHRNLLYQLRRIFETIDKNYIEFSGVSWVIGKRNNILAADVVQPLVLPTQYFQVHITSPNYNVFGMSIPGMPIFLCGRNDSVAWNSTASDFDDVDISYHKFDDKKTIFYTSKATTKKIETSIDTIKIRNKYKPNETNYDIYYAFKADGMRVWSDKMHNYTWNWLGRGKSDEIACGLKMMRCNNATEFASAAKGWQSPSMSFIFIDAKKNMGTLLADTAKGGAVNKIIFPYWNKQLKNSLPQKVLTMNPPSKIASIANTRVNSRLDELFDYMTDYDITESQLSLKDNYSVSAKNVKQQIHYVFSKYKYLLTQEEKDALDLLDKWNFIISSKSRAATIYNMFMANLMESTFKDELGDLYNFVLLTPGILINKLGEEIEHPLSDWYDDVRTSDREHLEYLVIRSFKDAIKNVETIYGTSNNKKWGFGRKHNTDIEYKYKISKQWQNIARQFSNQQGGSFSTIQAAPWNMDAPFKITAASSYRFVTDMQTGEVYSIIAGGVSGNPISPHYSDQLVLWSVGTYIHTTISQYPEDYWELMTRFIPK